MTGQSRVTIEEHLHIKIINKFIRIKNLGSYWIDQGISHGGSIKMNRGVQKSCFKGYLRYKTISCNKVVLVK